MIRPDSQSLAAKHCEPVASARMGSDPRLPLVLGFVAGRESGVCCYSAKQLQCSPTANWILQQSSDVLGAYCRRLSEMGLASRRQDSAPPESPGGLLPDPA